MDRDTFEMTVGEAMSLHTFGIETPIDGDKLSTHRFLDRVWKDICQRLRFQN